MVQRFQGRIAPDFIMSRLKVHNRIMPPSAPRLRRVVRATLR